MKYCSSGSLPSVAGWTGLPCLAALAMIMGAGVGVGVGVGGISGCANTPRTTSLTVDDLQSTAIELAEKLKASDLMKDRTSDSPKMIVTLNKVENLTNDLIPAGEQWYMMARIRDSLPIAALREQKNFAFVIPQEHLREGKDRGNFPDDYALARQPTHEMTATFRSARRAAGVNRTDAYECEFRITNLSTRELVFTDSVGFKRMGVGLAYD